MNKEIFLRDLRRFLSDLPEEEREQAVKYYEDYFEDAGPENEEQVICELGTPVDIAKQIKSVNPDNIQYGQGNDFHSSHAYPEATGTHANNQQNNNDTQNTYGNAYQNGNASQNAQQNGFQDNATQQNTYQNNAGNSAYTQNDQKTKWTQDSKKVTLVVVLAFLAIPVGIPILSTIFSLLLAILSVIAALTLSLFALGGGLAFGGIVSTVSSFYLISAGSVANFVLILGIGLTLLCIGIFIFYLAILFCIKFYPALFKWCAKICTSIGNGCKAFFC